VGAVGSGSQADQLLERLRQPGVPGHACGEALDGISRLVSNAATAYANTEQQIQQSMHS